ncbi:hypothetical protein R9C00_13475 [Flammeovirgaceae bacterium SG7u.111]|nr:hypothetical protein [Flammeovirgaceae bacterium SG7u.132]WPO38468.1 hypothetical protein R9C00_13475 [Flammeovirgaceae bacterium SG7u.111]
MAPGDCCGGALIPESVKNFGNYVESKVQEGAQKLEEVTDKGIELATKKIKEYIPEGQSVKFELGLVVGGGAKVSLELANTADGLGLFGGIAPAIGAEGSVGFSREITFSQDETPINDDDKTGTSLFIGGGYGPANIEFSGSYETKHIPGTPAYKTIGKENISISGSLPGKNFLPKLKGGGSVGINFSFKSMFKF